MDLVSRNKMRYILHKFVIIRKKMSKTLLVGLYTEKKNSRGGVGDGRKVFGLDNWLEAESDMIDKIMQKEQQRKMITSRNAAFGSQ